MEDYVRPINMRRCCVPGCENIDSKRHTFPSVKKEANMFEAWVNRIKPLNYESMSPEEIYRKYMICEEHFTQDTLVPGRRGLKRNALPSINIPGNMVAIYCSVESCWNSNASKHVFPNPLKNMELFKEWVRLTGNKRLVREYSPMTIFTNCRVCSIHFKDEDFGLNHRLKKGVIPSLLLPLALENVEFVKNPSPVSEKAAPIPRCSDPIRSNSTFYKTIPSAEFSDSKVTTTPTKVKTPAQVRTTHSEKPTTSTIDPLGSSSTCDEKIPSVVFSDTKIRTLTGKAITNSTERARSYHSPSFDSNIRQNSFEFMINDEVEVSPVAEESLSLKYENELYCRLCFCVSTDSNNYITIFSNSGENTERQDKIKVMIQKIIPDLDLSLTYNPGICTDCEDRLVNAYEFISFITQNETTLIDHNYKRNYDGYVNIQDVVKTFDNTSNKRPMVGVSDVPLKKQKTLISSNETEVKCDGYTLEHYDITVKEEPEFEYSDEPLRSTEQKSNQNVTEERCGRLLNTSANKDNNHKLKNIKVIVPNLKQTDRIILERNTRSEIKTYSRKPREFDSIRPPEIIPRYNISIPNIRVGGTNIKLIQTNISDTS